MFPFFESVSFLILSSFFIRALPALLFFGSSEIVKTLNYPEGMAPPLQPLAQIIFSLHQFTGLPLVFWFKFPGILADTAIPAMIYFLTYQASQDSRRAFFCGALYAFNPASIITTSFAGSDASVGLALLLASFVLFFISGNTPLSAVFLGTATAAQNLFLVFLPVFVMKSGVKKANGIFFFLLSALTFGCWHLPLIFQEGGTAWTAPDFLLNSWKEPLFGLTLAHEALTGPDFPVFLATFFRSYSSVFMDLKNFYREYFFLAFPVGLFIIFYFHRKQNPFVLSTNVVLFTLATWPRIYPFHLIWAIPFLIFTLNGGAKYFSALVSLFLIAWHSFIFTDSSAFTALKPLNAVVSDITLYQGKWVHGLFAVTGYLFIPLLLLLCLAISFFSRGNTMDHVKKKMGGRLLPPITFLFGIWLLAWTNPGLPFPWNRASLPIIQDLNRSIIHATPYGEGFYFRHVIDIDTDITQAGVKVVSDNPFIVYLNGKMVFSHLGGVYGALIQEKKVPGVQTHPIDLTPHLKKGKNVLAMESLHLALRPAGGLGIWWEIQENGKEKFSLPFFDGWKAVGRTPRADWTSLHFADSHWLAPVVVRDDPSKKINSAFKGAEGATVSMESALPPTSGKLFYMFPRNYTPPSASFTTVHFLILYTLLFFFAMYFFEGWLRAPYIFFQGAPNG